jgi:hypothetical protein
VVTQKETSMAKRTANETPDPVVEEIPADAAPVETTDTTAPEPAPENPEAQPEVATPEPVAAPKELGNCVPLQLALHVEPNNVWESEVERGVAAVKAAPENVFPYDVFYTEMRVGQKVDNHWTDEDRAALEETVKAVQRALAEILDETVRATGNWNETTEDAYQKVRASFVS